MDFVKLLVILLFLALAEGACSARIIANKPTGFAELEKAAINVLTNCYANRDKAIVVSGSFPGTFFERLSSRGRFSLALLDDRKRPMNNIDYSKGYNRNTRHKVRILVILAADIGRFFNILDSLTMSRYYTSLAFALIIPWSAEKKHAVCYGDGETADLLLRFNAYQMLKVILLCDHQHHGIVLFTSNPFANRAPKPWQSVGSWIVRKSPDFYLFARKYYEDTYTCKNLDYERTQDLGGSIVKTIRSCQKGYCSHAASKKQRKSRRYVILEKQRWAYVEDFIAHVNGTSAHIFEQIAVGGNRNRDPNSLLLRPLMMRLSGANTVGNPRGVVCMYLVTKFRGNKTQLQKILTVIDGYSWIGTAVVCLVTLMFFKYFLRQPLTDGLLNVMRLSCNMGLTTAPRNVAPQLYMACLLSFVVTMQGIFVSNLAALLTQDIPTRQVESTQDLADLGYTIYAARSFSMLFKGVLPEGRIVLLPTDNGCFKYVLKGTSNACLEADTHIRNLTRYHVHVSGCIRMEYFTHALPMNWALEETFNKYFGTLVAGGIVMPFHYIVDEKRILEAESQEVSPEPRVMTLNDLVFAFVILGVGATCALVAFVIELMIHRYRRRVRKTRVVFLK